MKANKGFTLIEIMIVVTLIGILTAIALPAYQDYVRRGKITEGVAGLTEYRVKMEQRFQDYRAYDSALAPPIAVANTPSFDYSVVATPLQYQITATGKGDLLGFLYTLNELNDKTTTSPWGNGACWITKKGGSC